MPHIDLSADLLTRLNTVAEKDYQSASRNRPWTDSSASTRSTSSFKLRPSSARTRRIPE
jgi:hypothetical protein